ncbi:hypothetical protein OC835_000746 [Tilletia horrida]|nr:hypothetical protein OC835_000746 [Tilletia horrida]
MSEDAMHPVQLYVYDLSHGMARQLSLAMTGRFFEAIYHTGIIVHGQEYFFGQGIMVTAPGQSHHGQPLQIIELGQTAIDKETWLEMLSELRQRYTAATYHLLNFNCNTFSNEVSELLTGNPIPEKIRSLPQDFLATPLGQMFRPQIDSTFSHAPSAGGGFQAPRARKNRKPSAAALGAAQSEAAAASKILDDVVASATAGPSATEWAVAGPSSSRSAEWTLEKALETFLARKTIFDEPEVVEVAHARLDKVLEAGPASSRIPQRILCLGLGNIKSGAVPQLQLGFLLLLREHVAAKLDGFCAVEAYDPAFTEDDKELLQALGIDVLEENKRGAYKLSEPTLVYMPHVGRGLTERLLRANWTEEGLERLILCSNDLDAYVTHVAGQKLLAESPCIALIAPHLAREVLPRLPTSHPQHVFGALNDMAYQRFAPSSPPSADFWTPPAKPSRKAADPETV